MKTKLTEEQKCRLDELKKRHQELGEPSAPSSLDLRTPHEPGCFDGRITTRKRALDE